MTTKAAIKANAREIRYRRRVLREAEKCVTGCEKRLAAAMVATVHGGQGTLSHDNAMYLLQGRQEMWRRRLVSALEWHALTSHKIEFLEADAASLARDPAVPIVDYEQLY